MASTAPSPRVLVVDDEPVVRDVLSRYLTHEGFEVDTAADGHAALNAIEARPPNVIVLDLMLPKLSGLELLRLVRLESTVPVIILSAQGERARADRRARARRRRLRDQAVLARRGGRARPGRPAPRERRAAMRRSSSASLVIDPVRREVSRGGEVVRTTRKEFDLLLRLASNPGRVYTRAELVESVWGYVWSGDTETVTVHIRRLRAKIEDDPSRPRRLVTVHGVGYRFEA